MSQPPRHLPRTRCRTCGAETVYAVAGGWECRACGRQGGRVTLLGCGVLLALLLTLTGCGWEREDRSVYVSLDGVTYRIEQAHVRNAAREARALGPRCETLFLCALDRDANGTIDRWEGLDAPMFLVGVRRMANAEWERERRDREFEQIAREFLDMTTEGGGK